MATFRKRGPYQWQAQVRKKGHSSQTKTFDTGAAAEQWAREIEYEMDRGGFVSRAEAESTTLGELLMRYLQEVTPLKRGAAPEGCAERSDAHLSRSMRFVSLTGILRDAGPGTSGTFVLDLLFFSVA